MMKRAIAARRDRDGAIDYLARLLTSDAAFMRGWIAHAEGDAIGTLEGRPEKIGYIVAREIEVTGALPSFDEVEWEIIHGPSTGSA